MRKYNEKENNYCLSNEHGVVVVIKGEGEDEDEWEGYYNGEFFISGSLGEVCRYMEGFIYALDYYKI